MATRRQVMEWCNSIDTLDAQWTASQGTASCHIIVHAYAESALERLGMSLMM